ncbi:TPA: hypothetical protein ACM396_003164 [Escherichia coli]|nr:hypothetical protein [Escherichia coli]MCV5089135.1 hypothetical protein [Escherichia coli]MCV5189841.1 hypothetical protein [Escherichia coli]
MIANADCRPDKAFTLIR